MQSRNESIIRAINNTKPYNIFTMPTHESYQTNWSGMPHTFYMFQADGIKKWNRKYRPLPQNHILLDGSEGQVKLDMKFDIALSQNKYGQFQIAKQVSDHLNIPLISLEHTLPMPHWGLKQMETVKNMRGNVNVFISEYSVEKWGFDHKDSSVRIIPHGINTEEFKRDLEIEKENSSLNIVNDFLNRDRICGYQEWLYISTKTDSVIRGDTPGLSTATSSLQELIYEYSRAKVFVNTTLISPIPTVVLEAMACSLPVVTLDNCMLPTVIKDGYNGFISNDIEYLVEKIQLLIKDDDLREELGANARKTIEERFGLDQHINKWEQLFLEVYGRGSTYYAS